MRSGLRLAAVFLAVICLGAAAFLGWKILQTEHEYRAGISAYDRIVEIAGGADGAEDEDHKGSGGIPASVGSGEADKDECSRTNDPDEDSEEDPDGSESAFHENQEDWSGSDDQRSEDLSKPADLPEINFKALQAVNSDVIGWIYSPDTKINYPVLQASNNDYYLYRLLDGTVNDNGSIFMDYRNDSTFKDGNTMIYGHHMQSGAMFADLMKYEKQSYYDQHPYLYILTPERNYRLDLFAAAVVQSTSDIYDTVVDDAVFQDCIKRSTFKSDIEFPTHNVVTLSTCTYDYHSDDRYVVLGELVPTD